MNFFTKIHELLRQKEQIVKKPRKHDANLQKNSTLYFQVGLIICLLTTNALLEMHFEKTPLPKPEVVQLISDPYTPVPRVKPKVIVVKKAEPKIEMKRPSFQEPIISNTEPLAVDPEPTIPDEPFVDKNLPIATPPPLVKKGPMGILGVEEVPIFPGCEELDGNSERIKCMSGKLAKLVQRKFNGDLAANHGLEGVQKIFVQFTIDKTGNVTSIETRSPHPSLDREAKRVMTKIPKMQPGKQSDIPVDVVYSLPIIFKVEN